VTRILYGLLSDLYVLVVRRYCLRSVDRFLSYGNLFGKVGAVNRCVNGRASDRDVLLELRAVSGCVNGGTGYTDLVSVDGGLDTSAVFAFDTVNGGVMGLVVTVNLNGRLGVGG